ncbi:glycosyltransferase [Bradyrhizobium sp. S69]|uniref:glycosyltransferase n=1 Tax=Bradyrhizobium sp. S69 TaxID=1641856 RepID=UPI00131EC9E7|nr:glycosyltransferase [Bradyrhizobium sp. S69]
MPAYNEIGSIAEILDVVRASLPGVSKEIVVVDDGSKDGTRAWLADKFKTLVGLSADILNVPTEAQALEHVRLYKPDVFIPARHDGALTGHMPLWRATEPVFQALKDADPGLVTGFARLPRTGLLQHRNQHRGRPQALGLEDGGRPSFEPGV